jgi:8-oxo-dGTP pyrophosphatase MutT (NUDIX family)
VLAAELLHPVKPTPGLTGAPVRSAGPFGFAQGRLARAPVPTRTRPHTNWSGGYSILNDKLGDMPREISAGGVVLQQISGVWHVALIEPKKETPESASTAAKVPRKRTRAVLALPKGLVDPGEKPRAAAVREVLEETGIVAEPVTKLSDNKYVYVRTWGDGERVFKIVSFYLMRYVSGEIDNLASDMRIEVKQALWVPLAEAAKQLAYSNERKVLRQTQDYLETQGSFP